MVSDYRNYGLLFSITFRWSGEFNSMALLRAIWPGIPDVYRGNTKANSHDSVYH